MRIRMDKTNGNSLRTVENVFKSITDNITVEEIDGRLWLNPGSCGRPRFGAPLTMAVLTIEDGVENQEWTVEKITISSQNVENRSIVWKKIQPKQK